MDKALILVLALAAITTLFSGCKKSEPAAPLESQSAQAMSQPLAGSTTSQTTALPVDTQKR
jgi:hypothetical protein